MLAFLALVACNPSAVLDVSDGYYTGPDDIAPDTTDDTDYGTTSGDDTSVSTGGDDTSAPTGPTHTGDTGPTHTGDTGPIVYDSVQVDGIETRVHSDYGTLFYVSWEQLVAATVWVEFSFDEGEWRSSPPIDAAAGPQEHLLLGIPYDEDFTWRIVNDFGGGEDPEAVFHTEDAEGETEEVPDEVPLPSVTIADEINWDQDTPWVLTSMSENGSYGLGGIWWAFIVDRQGRVVWARETPRYHMSMHTQLNYDKDALLIDYNTYWATYDASGGQIYELKIDGTEVAIYDTPGLHHPFYQLADGTMLWGAYINNNELLEELSPDGSTRTIWDCRDYLESIGDNDSCGSNTVYWNEPEDTVLFSMFTLDSVVEIDRTSGEVLRTFGHTSDAWSFDPIDSAFWYQHGSYYTPEGTLLLSTHDQRNERSTVVREYELDEETETLVEIWNFGLDDPLLGQQMGEAHRLASGNILHNYGTTPRLREATHDGEIVWDIEWERTNYIGRSTMLTDLYALAP